MPYPIGRGAPSVLGATHSTRSAMSMLTFYINGAGRKLSTRRRRRLDAAKNELRRLFGRKPAIS